MTKFKLYLQALALTIVSALASSYVFANDLYVKTGASINSLIAYNPYGSNAKEYFPAFNITGGMNRGGYAYEIGYTQAVPKDRSDYYPSYYNRKVEMDFSNIHADINRNILEANNVVVKAGLGLGVLKIKEYTSRYDFKTASRNESSGSIQLLQARANIGAQYEVMKNIHTNLDIQGQGSSSERPFLVGAGLNINYKF